jgi:hypothetical protein
LDFKRGGAHADNLLGTNCQPPNTGGPLEINRPQQGQASGELNLSGRAAVDPLVARTREPAAESAKPPLKRQHVAVVTNRKP